MAKRREYACEVLVGGAWQALTRNGTPLVRSSQAGAKRMIRSVASIAYRRAEGAKQPHEATVRIVDEYGAVVWPSVLVGR